MSYEIRQGKSADCEVGHFSNSCPSFPASRKVQGAVAANGFEKKYHSEYLEVHCNTTSTVGKHTQKVFFPWCFSI